MIEIKCPVCGGEFSKADILDGDEIVTCLGCGSKFPTAVLLKKSEAERVQEVKSNAYRDVEKERIQATITIEEGKRQVEKERLYYEIEKDKKKTDDEYVSANQERFKKSKFSKAIIIFFIISVMFCVVSFVNSRFIAAIVSLVQMALLAIAWLVGMQFITEKKRNFHKIPAIIAFVLIIPICFLYVGKEGGLPNDNPRDEYQAIVWSELELGDKLPDLGVNEADIVWDLETSLILYVYDFTEDRFKSYINECKEFGYTIDIDNSGANWTAYNSEGYKLHLSFWDFDEDKQFTIDLEDPIKRNTISWPNTDLLDAVPVPEYLIGEVSSEYSSSYAVYLVDVPKTYFSNYTNSCIANGFNIDYSKSDTYFHAKNSAGISITVEYKGFDTLYIWINNY